MTDDPLLVGGLKYLDSVYWPIASMYFNMELGEDEKHCTKDNILRVHGPVAENEGTVSMQIFALVAHKRFSCTVLF